MARSALTLALLLIACGDDDGMVLDGSVDAPMDATPDAPDAMDASDGSTPDPLTWGPCADDQGRFECGTLIVPVDYDDPDGPTMSIALNRWPALSPSERIGVLVYGPGAGGSGVVEVQRLVSDVTPMMGEVLRRFDVIGIDIRGTGGNDPVIDCLDDLAALRFIADIRAAADDAAVDAFLTSTIEQCRTRTGVDSLAPFDMVSTARDVDRLRELLGEEQISLIGLSYGTWFATVYAVRHPDRVRAAVLASAMPASNDAMDRVEIMIRGGEIALTGFFDWCDATTDCAFRPTTGTTREAFDALAASVIATPIGAMDRTIFRLAVFLSLYSERYRDLAAALEAAEMGDETMLLGALSPGDGNEWHIVHRALDETLAAGATVDDWRARLASVVTDAPSLGPLYHDRNQFVRMRLVWTDAPADPFTVEAIPSAPPFLFLAGQRDPVTPVEGAITLRDALGNGSVLLQEQLVGHFTTRDNCGRQNANDYLLDPTTLSGSPSLVTCPVVGIDETVVGTLDASIGAVRAENNRMETSIGDLVADAMRAGTGADVAMINGGGIRTSLPAAGFLPTDTALRRPDPGFAAGPPYDIVFEDVQRVLPFGNRVIVQELSGAELHAFLEASFRGGFIQVSGIRVSVDRDGAPGSVIQSLTLADGTTIANDDSATYTLALPDYVWYGGTGYYDFATGATGAPTLGEPLEDLLADYFVSATDVVAATDGRITLL